MDRARTKLFRFCERAGLEVRDSSINSDKPKVFDFVSGIPQYQM